MGSELGAAAAKASLIDAMSELPDDLLLDILSFLPTADALRTSALSRRWRHVWTGLSAFQLSDSTHTQTNMNFAGTVNAVLALAQRRRVDSLMIDIRNPLHKAHVNRWLQQAAERVHGTVSFRLNLFYPVPYSPSDLLVLDLPCGGTAAAMSIFHPARFLQRTLRIPPASTASCDSLTQLDLVSVTLEGGSLSDLVSQCCPNLKKIILDDVDQGRDRQELILSNDSLEEADLGYFPWRLRRLELACRNLRRLRILGGFSLHLRSESADGSKAASFRTPRLEDLDWRGSTWLHPSRVEFVSGMAMVCRLHVDLESHTWSRNPRANLNNALVLWLLRRCTSLSTLHLVLFYQSVYKNKGTFEDLMEAVPQLNSVTDLTVTTRMGKYKYGASIYSLLSRCRHLQKLTVDALGADNRRTWLQRAGAKLWPRRRRVPANWREDRICLEFLRHVELRGFTYWMDNLERIVQQSNPLVLKIPYDK